MRYRKGSIAISGEFDIPLMLLIRNSGYVTHQQLIALSGHDQSASKYSIFLWRIRRLLAAGLVALLDRRIEGHKVYSITHAGLTELESFGHSLASLNSRTQVICYPPKMMHCLELNALRLAMVRDGIAEVWLTDVEVCAENLMADDQYVKDYDAIAVINVGDRSLTCAVEYERSNKSVARYSEIRSILSDEHKVDLILYILRDAKGLIAIARHLAGAHPGILFVTAAALRRMGQQAYAVRTLSQGGSLSTMLGQVADEVQLIRRFAIA